MIPVVKQYIRNATVNVKSSVDFATSPAPPFVGGGLTCQQAVHLESVDSPAVLLVAVGHVDAARANHERLVDHGKGK